MRAEYGSATMSSYLSFPGSVSPAAQKGHMDVCVKAANQEVRIRGAQRTDPTQNLQYAQTVVNGTTSVDLMGFYEQR